MMRLLISVFGVAMLLSCSTGNTQTNASEPVFIGDSTPPPAAEGSGRMAMSAPVEAPALPGAPKNSYSEVNVDGPYIAMTFDDGPSKQLTPKLLDILKERNIKATFFVLGQNVQEFPEIAHRIVAEGHEIGNHSWSHPSLPKLSTDGVRSQMQRTQDAIASVTGVKSVLMRPPYGALNQSVRKIMRDDFAYKVILWSVDPLDWKYRNPARVEREIVEHAHNGSIILAHDIHATTIAAMPQTLDRLLAKGFKFVTVSELLAMERPPAPKPVPSPASAEKQSEHAAATSRSDAAAAAGAATTRPAAASASKNAGTKPSKDP